MEKQEMVWMTTGFPMRHPEMLIGRPAELPSSGSATEQEYAQDTETWD